MDENPEIDDLFSNYIFCSLRVKYVRHVPGDELIK